MYRMTLIPAYGQHAATAEELQQRWQEGKDFKIFPGGPYTSVRDIEHLFRVAERVFLYDRLANVGVELKHST